MNFTNNMERRVIRNKTVDDKDKITVDECDDYLIIREIEDVYLRLEKIQHKLETDKLLCPDYNKVIHGKDPLTPDMSQAGPRAQIYELLMCEDAGWIAYMYYIFTIILIIISLVSLVFEEQYESPVWENMELVITMFFTLEYFLTLVIVRDRISFLCSASIFDILAVLPWYIEIFAGDESWILLVRLLRIARMNRIRQSPNPYVFLIGKTLSGVTRILSGIFLWLSIGSLIIGTFVHVIEDVEFPTIPLGMWYGLVTLTTVGYGDLYPKSTEGKLVGSVAIIFGLCLCSIVLQAVGQVYNDNIEILKDQMMEIKAALFEKHLIVVLNGDDLHIQDNVTFDDMIRCCMDDEKCYPKINTLLDKARGNKFTYLEMGDLKEIIGEKHYEKYLEEHPEVREALSETGKRSPESLEEENLVKE